MYAKREKTNQRLRVIPLAYENPLILGACVMFQRRVDIVLVAGCFILLTLELKRKEIFHKRKILM